MGAGSRHGEGSGDGAGSAGAKRETGQKVKTVYIADEKGDEATAPVYVSEPSEDVGGSSQKEFFEFPGPLFKAAVSPAKALVPVGEKKRFSAVAKDKKGVRLDSGFTLAWEITEGEGSIDDRSGFFIEYTAPEEPCVTSIGCIVTQEETEVLCEAPVTVTAELGDQTAGSSSADRRKKGLPGDTYRKAPGELWRSKYDAERYIIIINNGHADFIYASRQKSRKLRYIAKLFAKELVLAHFPELTREQVIERMIELQLYTEENL